MITIQRRIQALSRLCANSVPGTTSIDYNESVAGLIFMTLAHESDNFKARRQYGFRPDTTRGAFGLAQVEMASLRASLRQMWADTNIGRQSMQFLACAQSPLPTTDLEAARVLQEPMGDALSVLFCRLHYWRVPRLVPWDRVEQSEYAKKFYNTHLGKATPGDYLGAFKRHWPEG